MKDPSGSRTCKSCGHAGKGNYCPHCGQSLNIRRISLGELARELYHAFTHIERGFFYTLSQLIVAPGRMQADYIAGKRHVHQKPFPMFLLCATIAALCRYWTFSALTHYYHVDTLSEATFFHEYMVPMFVVLVPIYVLIIHLAFYKSGYNYAEIGVVVLYTVSIFFLMASAFSALHLVSPHIDTAYVEFPVFTGYMTITLVHFFRTIPWWTVTLKSILIMIIVFAINQATENLIIQSIS